jgi:hypothetical protein
MARLARVVIPGLPHHITRWGNRRQPAFFNDEDYAAYLHLLSQWCKELIGYLCFFGAGLCFGSWALTFCCLANSPLASRFFRLRSVESTCRSRADRSS